MGHIVVGSEIYVVGNTPNVTYRISPSVFRGVRPSAKRGIIVYDLAGLVVRGHELLDSKPIQEVVPEVFHTREIKEDILSGEDRDDNEARKLYLRRTRKWWENERYTSEDLIWMADFHAFIGDLECRVGDEWFRLYEMVRGEIPEDFPAEISFAVLIDNVFDRWSGRYIDHTIKKYLAENPDAVTMLRGMRIPEGLPLWPEIGLTPEEYMKYATRYILH